MLLLPLGIDVDWTSAVKLQRGDLYYGPRDSVLPKGVLSLPFSRYAQSYFETAAPYDLRRVRMRTWEKESWPVLFPGDAPKDDDLVASAFFWLAAWQEHVVRRRDVHARFVHEDSLQCALGTTGRPVVDAYRTQIAAALRTQGITPQPRRWGDASWALCPTVDVDYLTKWRKGMIYRETVEHLVCNLHGQSAGPRIRRFGQFLRDALRPGDVYQKALERIHTEIRQHGTGTFFVKAASHGPKDVHYALHHPFLTRFAAALRSDGFEIGVHPSYHAHTHIGYMASERQAVAAMSGQHPLSVRQHYLRYEAPITPRIQERVGFGIDATLGFAEIEGFRNGTCMPFLRYDCAANAVGSMWQMPLAIMESALFNRRGLSLAAASEATRGILAECERFGGVAVLLWHGVLWDEMDHPGWGAHFLETLTHAVKRQATVASLKDALSAWLGHPAEIVAQAANESAANRLAG